jgi:hypothetical protein
MTSARTSLGEVRTRRRSRRAAGPSASARRAASSQNTGARAHQRPGPEAGHATKTYIRLAVYEDAGRGLADAIDELVNARLTRET